MTEDDLIRIEKQIENLQVMHKVTEVERELEQLERELHQLLPVSAALNSEHFSVNPKQVHGQAEDLPAWCSKISTLLKSMAILLATLGGKEIDILDLVAPGYTHDDAKNMIKAGQAINGNIGRSQSFSTREEVEKEIKQCGVSVKNLKANYELQNQSKCADDSLNRVYKRKRSLPVVSECGFQSEPILEDDLLFLPSDVQSPVSNTECSDLGSTLPLVDEPLITPTHVPVTYTPTEGASPLAQVNGNGHSANLTLNPDQMTRSLEVQTDLSYVQECIEMRKERIVFLFLEHWRKYTMSESYRPKYAGRSGNLGGGQDLTLSDIDGDLQSDDDRLLYFMKQRQVVGNLLGHWRNIMSQVPTRQIRRLSRAQMIYWPEHFLPHINGGPVDYNNLTLDLFMLGYFQLLEMNMSRSERKFRHLLCYEMFDRLGSHSWELIRSFHREVMESIEHGARDWSDGFEDIKVKYFGDSSEGGGLLSASEVVLVPELLKQQGHEQTVTPQSQSIAGPSEDTVQTPVQDAPKTRKESIVQDSAQSSTLVSTQDVAANNVTTVEEHIKEVSHQAEGQNPVQENSVPNGEQIHNDAQNTLINGTHDPGNTSSPQPPEDITPVQAQASVQLVVEGQPAPPSESALVATEPNEDSIQLIYELKEFSNEEIIRYIDRSFAFWKEKEAELFDI
ncbi:espin-like protein [Denticeps clupeoides]|nr:espin-like protein [Denticeps clupeoides]